MSPKRSTRRLAETVGSNQKMKEIKKITGIKEYCQHLNIREPKFPWFDVQRFEDNMPTIKKKVEPFRHDLFAIGLLKEGTSNKWHGIKQMKADLIFNSPYQLISWDIIPDWTGYYVIFSKDFINKCSFSNNFINRFSFFQLDRITPIEIDKLNRNFIYNIFSKIYDEHRNYRKDSFPIIEALVYTLLVYIKRSFNQQKINQVGVVENNTSYHQIFSRFHSELEIAFFQNPNKKKHSVSFYGEQLNLHPNYLNSIVKKITGLSTKQYIDSHIGQLAQKLLLQSKMSVKEIGYELGFEEPAHFNNFFKRVYQKTPTQYKKSASL